MGKTMGNTSILPESYETKRDEMAGVVWQKKAGEQWEKTLLTDLMVGFLREGTSINSDGTSSPWYQM